MADPRPRYGAQTKARKAALDVLFAADVRGQGIVDTLTEQRTLGESVVRDLTTQITLGVAEHLDEIDRRLAASLTENWTLARMPSIDRNLARIAIFELDHTSTPAQAVIAEAVKLAGDLSTDDSPAFLNGLLANALASRPPTPDED
ncbi:MAG: transcription antitermination factor NusB [Arachnia sp.]